MMKYERPIMNISMFKLENVVAGGGDITNPSVIATSNMEQAQIDGRNAIMTRANRALVVIEFND